MAELKLALLVGAESKEWLANLTKQIDRLERLSNPGAKEVEAVPVEAEEEDSRGEIPKKRGRKPKAKFAEGTGESEDSSDTDISVDDDEDFPTVKTKGSGKSKKSESFDEDDTSENADDNILSETDDTDDDEPKPKKRFKKSANLSTIDDVNNACKDKLAAYVDERGVGRGDARKLVLRLLKKEFGVSSPDELTEDQYADAVAVLKE